MGKFPWMLILDWVHVHQTLARQMISSANHCNAYQEDDSSECMLMLGAEASNSRDSVG